MNKLSKDPIDQFFKEALRSPDLKYNKQDWKGLEARLPRKAKNKTIAWLLPAAAALLIFVSLWLSDGSKTENQPLSKTGAEFKIEDSQMTGIDKAKESTRKDNLEKRSPLPSVSNTASGLAPSETVSSSKSLSNNLSAFATDQPANYRSDHFLQAEPVVLAESFTVENNKFNAPKISGIKVLPQVTEAISKAEKVPHEKVSGRFSLAFAVSPDINSVDNFSNNDLGASIGMGASYRINKHLSLGTGIAYSKKVYSALPNQYEAPWANSNAAKYAESIDADCRVLDIPLNLRYTFTGSPKQAFFISGGLSSYFMLEETYTLVGTAQPGHPTYTDPSYSYKNENKHPLSVANFSVGINKPLNKQTSIVIEPYVKLPLTGIGQGKVNLQSTGVIFQLQYNLTKKQKVSP
jgi:hypothetical protein